LDFDVQSKAPVHEHSMVMSTLRNLINNAIEAIEGNGEIKLIHTEDEYSHYFTIIDNGSGMDAETLGFIFNAGFSTKYDDYTGNSNRGIGLTLVKDIIENYFDGRIEVFSKPKTGTRFELQIPKVNI